MDIPIRRPFSKMTANTSVGVHGTFDMLFMSQIPILIPSFSLYLIIALKPNIFFLTFLGYVLATFLFIYIDIDLGLNNFIKFVDDTKIGNEVLSEGDRQSLQNLRKISGQ